jgi:hypothetical protein
VALSRFERTAHDSEGESMKAIAHLPGLDIEIVHHQSPDGLAEQISINLKAVPSFEAFVRFYEAMNPFAFWAEATRLAWLPWVEAMRAATLPQAAAQPPKRRPELPSLYSELS